MKNMFSYNLCFKTKILFLTGNKAHNSETSYTKKAKMNIFELNFDKIIIKKKKGMYFLINV